MSETARRQVPYYRHDLGRPEVEMLEEVLRGGILTTGEYVKRFEERFSALLQCRHTLAVSSCTGALHLSLLALGIGPGDEVITTPMTFAATATSILEAGAKPVFVDVEPATGNLDVALIEPAITPRTRAILPVHLYGLMCDMRAIRNIADAHGLKIVEDSAHCVEASRDGIRPGQLGDAACFSFFATKNLTCGEGGAVSTNSTELYEKLKLFSLHGLTKSLPDRPNHSGMHWDMVVLGWKYNMSNIEAALLLPQFDRVAEKLERRTQLASRYDDRMRQLASVRKPGSFPDVVHSRHVYPIRVPAGQRDAVIEYLKQEQVGCVVNYRAVHLMRYFRENYGFAEGDFPHAENIGDETISLPFFPDMPPEDVDIVVSTLQRALADTS